MHMVVRHARSQFVWVAHSARQPPANVLSAQFVAIQSQYLVHSGDALGAASEPLAPPVAEAPPLALPPAALPPVPVRLPPVPVAEAPPVLAPAPVPPAPVPVAEAPPVLELPPELPSTPASGLPVLFASEPQPALNAIAIRTVEKRSMGAP